MARARNIKPSFFSNDELGEIEPVGRLLFIGLWTLCDHKGDLEWRSKRIKAQLLPYDECDIEQLAINLDKSGFIRFYSDGDKLYVRVLNFEKHQNPHKNEKAKGSEIPGYCDWMREVVDLEGLTINRDKSRQDRNDSTTDPADSLILNPESPVPESREATHAQLEKISSRGEHATPEQLDRLFDQTPPPDHRFAMTLDWKPNEKHLATRLMTMGINLKSQPPLLVSDSIAAFRNHQEANGRRNSQSAWVAQLANWIQRDVRRAESMPRAVGSDVPPLPRLRDFPEDD